MAKPVYPPTTMREDYAPGSDVETKAMPPCTMTGSFTYEDKGHAGTVRGHGAARAVPTEGVTDVLDDTSMLKKRS